APVAARSRRSGSDSRQHQGTRSAPALLASLSLPDGRRAQPATLTCPRLHLTLTAVPRFPPDHPATEDSMSRFTSIAAAVALFMSFHVASSWGQGVNPTVSDTNANTAGGTSALGDAFNVSGSGEGNTAFGDAALLFTTSGSFNTAVGDLALEHNDI